MARRRRKARKATYRDPPMPEWFKTAPWGHCRWCNKPILNDSGQINTRRHWHKECLHPYFLITRQSYAKRFVKKRDKGICSSCGKHCRYRSEWDLDHIKPLIEAKGDINFWKMGNLTTNCVECHLKKTLKENAERRKKRHCPKTK